MTVSSISRDTTLSPSEVFFTSMRIKDNETLPQKLERLVLKA